MTYLDLRVFSTFHTCSDTVRAQTDSSGMEGTKKLEQWRWRPLNFSRGTQGIAIFFNSTQKISTFSDVISDQTSN